MLSAAEHPKQASHPPAGQTSGVPTSLSPRERARGRVLVVDDDPLLRRSIIRLLSAKGYEVESAENGVVADSLVRTQEFDVVLSDIAMPIGDGIRLLRSVRDYDPDVPVVLITGEPAVKTAVQALEHGAFHYLTKPVDLETLEEVVDKAACLRRMAVMKRQAADLLNQDLVRADLDGQQRQLDSALNTLWMAYQPIVHASTGEVYGFEALLRSGEPSFPHPGVLIEAAEKLEQLDLLGRTIRARSAADMVAAPAEALLFVNLHPSDLMDPSLFDPASPLSALADRVVLEITERSSIEAVRDVRQRVARLREMGFRIAVDDLGAGYAGLTSFAILEPEIVKLDMTLVRNVHQSQTRQKLIRSMTELCKDMGMLVVGEGVETPEELIALQELGCDLLQGYLLSKPQKPFPTPVSLVQALNAKTE